MQIRPCYSLNIHNSYSQKSKSNLSFCSKGLFPGSFDPITNGHVDIIKRASKLFENLTILVSKNSLKSKNFLSEEMRVKLIENIIKSQQLKNVKVACTPNFAAKFVEGEKDIFIVRGLRDANDFDYEMDLLKTSREINPEIDIIFLPTKEGLENLSSSVIREMFKNKQDISSLVPKCVNDFLEKIKK